MPNQVDKLQINQIGIIIPTYNNAGTLSSVVSAALEQSLPVIVVNDGSTDETKTILAKFPSVTVKTHGINLGKGAALTTGLQLAKFLGWSAAITIDSDGQHRPADLVALVSEHEKSPGSIVLGTRNLSDQKNVPASSLFGCKFSNFWIRMETGKTLSDTQSGFRLYPVKSILELNLTTKKFDWEIEVLVRSSWSGIKIREAPVSVTYTPAGGRISHFHKLWDNLRLTVIHSLLCTLRIVSIPQRAIKKIFFGKKESQHESPGAKVLNFFVRNTGIYFCYAGTPFVVFFYYLFSAKARRAVTKFYSQAFGMHWLTASAMAYRNFLYFAAILIDRLAMSQGQVKAISCLQIYSPIERPPPRSILLGAHFGDWLLCGAALGVKCDDKIGIVMNLEQNPQFQSLALNPAIRERLCVIDAGKSKKEIVLGMMNVLSENGHICFLADRRTSEVETIDVPFFGANVKIPTAAFEVASRLKLDAYCFFCVKSAYHPKAKYKIYIYKIADSTKPERIEALVANYIKILEGHVKESPQNWFNFFDFWQAENEYGTQHESHSDRLRSQAAH